MTTKNLALKSTLSMGLGIILGCVLAVNSPPGQSSAAHDGDGDGSGITSSPGENSQVDDGIDYENAKPMPLPSVPVPPNLEAEPGAPPSTNPTQNTPGSSPGDIGNGKKNPQVLVPPKPLQGTD
jgi:hypothetical protein